VTLPKSEGGLGVLNLRTQNEALLLKYLHKFFNKVDTPWVHLIWEKYYSNGTLPSDQKKGSFWWRDILKLLDTFKGMAMVTVSNGSTCKFWDDLWLNRVLKLHFPELYSFTSVPNISLRAALSVEGPHELFNLPISNIALQQLAALAQDLSTIQEVHDSDIWSYIWGSAFFSSSKAYKHLTGHRIVHVSFKWLWKSAVILVCLL